jgi:hypothetical protein
MYPYLSNDPGIFLDGLEESTEGVAARCAEIRIWDPQMSRSSIILATIFWLWQQHSYLATCAFSENIST